MITTKKLMYLPNTYTEVKKTVFGYLYSDIHEKYKTGTARNFNITRVDLLTPFIEDTFKAESGSPIYESSRELYVKAVTGEYGDVSTISRVLLLFYDEFTTFRRFITKLCMYDLGNQEKTMLSAIQGSYNKEIADATEVLREFCRDRDYKVLDFSQGYAYVAVPSYVYDIEAPEGYVMEVVSNAEGRKIVYCRSSVRC